MFFKSHSGGFSAKQLETSPWGLQGDLSPAIGTTLLSVVLLQMSK